MSTVNVALLYQTSQFETHLREALRELGAAVVYEALAADVDRDALEGSGASVVIVNLDPEVESHIDEVYDLLDDDRYNVLFNDGTVSSGLQGWDQARWARHLAAKILGKPEATDPPRPAGAEAPRSPAQRYAETIPDMPAAPAAAAAVPAAAVAPTPSPFAGDNDLHNALDALLARADTEPGPQALRPVQADPGEVRAPERAKPSTHAVDLRAEFDAKADAVSSSAKPVPPPPASVPDTFDFAAELDSLVGGIPDSALASESARAVEPAATQPAASSDFDFDFAASVPTSAVAAETAPSASSDNDFAADLDALFADAGGTPPLAVMSSEFGIEATGVDDLGATARAAEFASDLPSELDAPAFPDADDLPPLEGDFPALFERFEADTSAAPAAPAKTAEPAKAAKPGGGLGAFADWSLDPLDESAEETPAPLAAKPVEPKPTADTFGVKKMAAEDFLAGKDWGLEDLTEESADAGTPAKPAKPALPEVKVEKVAAQDFLAPEGGDADKFKFNLDSSLDLMPMEEAVSPEQQERQFVPVEHRLDEVVGARSSKIKRAIVLGASIGGPEAVREYLAAMPARFPALFLLAQHMGQEFLELMSAQLAKVTPLVVRNPTHGERVYNGEVVVVPTDKRLVIDADGVVQLRPLMESSPYSPSIDLVIKDITDNFGANATAIIFSGMAHDAIEGSKYLAAKGGTVWVQDPDTCVISSMVDGANEAGVVSFSAAPAQLAQQTIAVYGKS